MRAAMVVALGLVAGDRQPRVLELLEQPVDVVGVHSPGLAEARGKPVREIATVARTFEQKSEQRTAQRR
jgi:hypothetical protein